MERWAGGDEWSPCRLPSYEFTGNPNYIYSLKYHDAQHNKLRGIGTSFSSRFLSFSVSNVSLHYYTCSVVTFQNPGPNDFNVLVTQETEFFSGWGEGTMWGKL